MDQIVNLAFKDKDRVGHIDMESLEMSIRTSMHGIGSMVLSKFINRDGGDYRGRTISCDKGHAYEFVEYRDKEVLTVLGPVAVNRAYYYDKECKTGCCPKDRALDIEGTSGSPGVRRMMSRVGAYLYSVGRYRPSYPWFTGVGLGHEDLYELAGIRVNAKEVERVSQETGHYPDFRNSLLKRTNFPGKKSVTH